MNSFKVAMLASGSKGNAAVIINKNLYFLVDMGLSCRELVKRLKDIHLKPELLTAVFITHEHSDHIKGLATFSKKYQTPIFASERTWRAILSKDNDILRSACHIIVTNISYNHIKISSFDIPHDAADPHGYIFEDMETGAKCSYLTDTGFITDTVRKAVDGAEVLVLEANHDVEMLKNGKYPLVLKQRILSTRGHLSNESAGLLLTGMKKLPKQIYLAHLSEENNKPSLALDTVKKVLSAAGKKEPNIMVASQHEVVTDYLPPEQNIFGEG